MKYVLNNVQRILSQRDKLLIYLSNCSKFATIICYIKY